MKTDQLIESLVSELEPVQRLYAVQVRAWLWAGGALLCVCAGTLALGPRRDLMHKLTEPAYLNESAALFALFACSAWGAFRASIPGLGEGSRYAPLVALSAWLTLISARALFSAHEPEPLGLACVARMLVLGLAPTLSLFAMLRRAAPLDSSWTGQLAMLAGTSVAMLGTQAICAKDSATHVLLWHFMPVLFAACAGLGIGRRLLRVH